MTASRKVNGTLRCMFIITGLLRKKGMAIYGVYLSSQDTLKQFSIAIENDSFLSI